MTLDPIMKTELEKLRDQEAKLEQKISDEKGEVFIRNRNITQMATQLSDCKKAIASLTLVKLNAAS